MRISSPQGDRLRRQVRAALFGTALAVAAPGAMAATITVNSNADMTSADQCTLRDAITAANMNQENGGCTADGAFGDDMIVFDNVDSIMLSGTALPTVASDGGTLTIGMQDTDDTDETDDSTDVTIDANSMSRIFVNQGDLTLNGLTLTNGVANAADGDDTNGSDVDDRSGGAILNDDGGVLTVNGGAMTNNTSDRAGGAIEEASGVDTGNTAVTLNGVDFSGNDAGANPGNGGVLHVTGSGDIAVNGGTFESNTAREGGALWNNGGTMTVDGATFTMNTATGGDADQGGGAIFGDGLAGTDMTPAGGTIVVTASTFNGNNVGSDDVTSMDGSDSSASGGAILAGDGSTLNVTNSVFTMNTARRAGGAFEVRGGTTTTLINVTAIQNEAGMNPGNGGALHVTGDGNVDISGGLFSSNFAVEGGALWNNQGTMTLDGVSLISNEATGDDANQGGGGIYAEAASSEGGESGTLTITNSRFASNSASGMAGSGGGILLSPGVTSTVDGSLFMANTSNRAGGAIEVAGATLDITGSNLGGFGSDQGNDAGDNPGNGGAVHLGGAGDVSIENTAVGYNSAVNGGGLWTSGAGSMDLTNSTVANNSAMTGAGVYLDGAGGTIDLSYVSVTNNDGTGVFAVDGAGDSITVNSSLVSGNSPDVGDGVVVDNDNVTGTVSLNGMYRLYGGPTPTQPLAMDSAAVDFNDFCGDMDTDQRGVSRPVDLIDDDNGSGDCDAGAFELNDDSVITVAPVDTSGDTIAEGDEDVTVAGFTLSTSETDGATIGGLNGYIARDVRAPAGFTLAGLTLEVYEDTNENGMFDDGTDELVPGTGSVADNGYDFSVTFTGGLMVDDTETDYLLVASMGDADMVQDGTDDANGNDGVVSGDGATPDPAAAAPLGDVLSGLGDAAGGLDPQTSLATPRNALVAGGGLLALMGLLSIGGIRRRTQLLLIVAALALTLTACSDGDGNVDLGGDNGMDDDNVNDNMPANTLQFVITSFDPSTAGDEVVQGDGLPVAGSNLSPGTDDAE